MTWSLTVALVLAATLQSPPAGQQPSPDAAPRAQAVLSAILAGEFVKVEEQFTPEMKAALPSGRLAAIWSSLLAKGGAHKGCGTNVRVVTIADKQMVITPCTFERAEFDVQFAFDRAGRLSGMTFRPAATAAVPYTLPSYASAAA